MQTQQLIRSLVSRGIDTFFISPGSRNYELIEAINSIAGVKTYVHYDERGLAFFALGYALASKKIPAIVVTSGSAVGLLLPAVMEAYHSGIPLILLTADRPASLKGSGANQTCDQREIFSSFVRRKELLDLTLPGKFDPEIVAENAISAIKKNPGPVHLNCHLKAPTPIQCPKLDFEVEPTFIEESKSSKEIEELAHSFLSDPNALVLIGRNFPLRDSSPFKGVQISSNCHVCTDLLSRCRGLFSKEIPLAQLNSILPKVERVLHLGGSFINTNILSYLEKQPLTEYVQISQESYFFDPHRILTKHIALCPWGLLKKLAEDLASPACQIEDYSPSLPLQGQFLKALLHEREVDTPIYVSNSTLVRDFDQFYYPKGMGFAFHSNRGLSGSDGNLATFLGMCLGYEKKCMGFLGDIALLHDLNSLPMISHLSYGAELFLFNNNGGDIFRRLSHCKASNFLESHYTTAHSYSLRDLVNGFGHKCIEGEWIEDIEPFDEQDGIKIYEMRLSEERSFLRPESLALTN